MLSLLQFLFFTAPYVLMFAQSMRVDIIADVMSMMQMSVAQKYLLRCVLRVGSVRTQRLRANTLPKLVWLR